MPTEKSDRSFPAAPGAPPVDAEAIPGTIAADNPSGHLFGAGVPLEGHIAWLKEFAARRGRPLRVLHVGNIANNAYLNAKFLRSVGVDAHVLCYDYRHVMATPEWEDVEFRRSHGDDFSPKFSRRDLRGYRRPSWFVSGPLPACVPQIAALCGEAPLFSQKVAAYLVSRAVGLSTALFGPLVGHGVELLVVSPRQFTHKFWGYMRSRLGAQSPIIRLISRLGRPAKPFLLDSQSSSAMGDAAGSFSWLLTKYDAFFPCRTDRLCGSDIEPFLGASSYFGEIFRHYDIVQCYATEPLYALMTGKRPYVAYEHGTLRDFTMGDASLHRLTALAYRSADHVFITNGDCLTYAKRLGIKNYSPIIHPVDVSQHRIDYGADILIMRRELDADVVLFCPIRHDWKIKGTDLHLRALPLIKRRVTGRVKLVLIRWGQQVAESEALLDSLGCSDDVVWRSSMCRITMIKHIQAADVVLDQMALPHFGATAPQAIASGIPVISSYIEESTNWIIPEPAPILAAFSPEDVADAALLALDPNWRGAYELRARNWTDRYHHPNNVIGEHLNTYRKVLRHE